MLIRIIFILLLLLQSNQLFAQTSNPNSAPSQTVGSPQFALLPQLSVNDIQSKYPCNNASKGLLIGATDVNTPLSNGALVGGSTGNTLAYCDGTFWKSVAASGWSSQFPNWTSPFPNVSSFGNTPINQVQINVGSYPLSEQHPAGVDQALVSYLKVPSSYTNAPYPNTAISGYTLNGNSTPGSSAVSLFGFSGVTTDGASSYGNNVLVTNTAHYVNTSGGGFNGGFQIGYEADIGIFKRAGVAPNTTAYGYNAEAFFEAKPLGGSAAYVARPGSGQVWDFGFLTFDGSVSYGMQIGALATAAPNVDGQPVKYISYNGSGTTLTGQFYQDHLGNWIYTSPTGGHIFQNNGTTETTISSTGINATGHLTVTSPNPTIASGLGTGPSIAGSDTAGRITVGTGSPTNVGTINFGTTYGTAPSCVANDETTASVNPVRTIASTSQLQLATSAANFTASDKLTYICIAYN